MREDLGDFGIARAAESTTRMTLTGAVIGRHAVIAAQAVVTEGLRAILGTDPDLDVVDRRRRGRPHSLSSKRSSAAC